MHFKIELNIIWNDHSRITINDILELYKINIIMDNIL